MFKWGKMKDRGITFIKYLLPCYSQLWCYPGACAKYRLLGSRSDLLCQNLHFNKIPRQFALTLKFEKHISRMTSSSLGNVCISSYIIITTRSSPSFPRVKNKRACIRSHKFGKITYMVTSESISFYFSHSATSSYFYILFFSSEYGKKIKSSASLTTPFLYKSYLLSYLPPLP